MNLEEKKVMINLASGLKHDWLASYLNNRERFCRVNGASSDISNNNCGVPQGSRLGQLLRVILRWILGLSMEVQVDLHLRWLATKNLIRGSVIRWLITNEK